MADWLAEAIMAVLAVLSILGFVWRKALSKSSGRIHQLERECARLNSVLEATTDFVGFANAEGIPFYLNPAARRMLGLKPEEPLSGHSIRDFHPDWVQKILWEQALPAARREGAWRGETALVSREGGEIPISQVIVAHKSADGTVDFFSTTARDITATKQAQESLRQSEERFARLSEAAFEGIAITEQGIMLDANEQYAQLVGYDLKELIARPVSNVVAPESKEAVAEAQRLGREGVYDHWIVRKDGTKRLVEVSAKRAPYRGGIARVTAIRDITERRFSENLVAESEERFRKLVECAPEAIVVLDIDLMRFVDFNQNAVRLFDCDAETLAGLGPADVSPPRQPDGRTSSEAAGRYLQEALDGGTPVFEWTHLSRSGRQISCEVRLVRLPAAGKRLVRGSITDITERKASEQRLKESEQRFRTLLETSPDVLVVAVEEKIVYCNPPALRLAGVAAPEDVLGRSVYDFVPKEHLDKVKGRRERVTQRKSLEPPMEYRWKRDDGAVFELESRVFAFMYGGQPALLNIIKDISDRKASEEQIATQLKELRRWYRVTLGREDRLAQLKAEVNSLAARLGEPPRYSSPGLGPGPGAARPGAGGEWERAGAPPGISNG